MFFSVFLIFIIAILLLVMVTRSRYKRSKSCNVPFTDFGGKSHWFFGIIKIPISDLSRLMMEKSRTFGELFRIRAIPWMPSTTFVVANEVGLIKEMLERKEFSSRSPVADAGMRMINPEKKGIGLQDYTPAWRNLHKLSFSILNLFGFGKQSMENMVLEEADALISEMLSIKEAFSAIDPIRVAIANIICQIIFGERSKIQRRSPLHEALFVSSEGYFDLGNELSYILFPKLIDWYKTPRAQKIHQSLLFVKSFIKSSVSFHEETLDETEEPRDFIDAFIRERRQHPGAEHLSEENMMKTIMDLFLAGTDTTTSLLNWTIAWLLHNPDVVEKLQAELFDVLGEDGKPSMAVLKNLNYLRAFMDEVQRMSTVADFTVPHCCSADAEFRGYTIPKGEKILFNIYSVHRNPDLWKEPEIFKPERFLNGDGHYQKNPNLIPFGWGIRRCLGERLARLEQFIFTARMVQRLSINPGSRLPDMKGQLHFVRMSGPFAVKVERRRLTARD